MNLVQKSHILNILIPSMHIFFYLLVLQDYTQACRKKNRKKNLKRKKKTEVEKKPDTMHKYGTLA